MYTSSYHTTSKENDDTNMPCPYISISTSSSSCPHTPSLGVQYLFLPQDHLFLTSVAHPSIPSPLLPTGTSSFTPSIPLVPSRNLLPAIPPAFALFAGSSSSIGRRNSAIRLLSSTLKWYFSLRTSGSAQCLNRWIFRSSPLRLKISWDHFPERQRDRGKGPSSSMICAMWSSSLPYFVPDCGSKR